LQKLTDVKASLQAELTAGNKQLEAIYEMPLTDGPLTMKQDLEANVNGMTKIVDRIIEKDLKPLLLAAKTENTGKKALEAIARRGLVAFRSLHVDQEYVGMKTVIAKTKRQLTQDAKRKSKVAKTGDASEQAADGEVSSGVLKAPLQGIMEAILAEHPRGVNTTTSLYESKLGLRMATVQPKPYKGEVLSPSETLAKNQYFKSLAKSCLDHMKTTGQNRVRDPCSNAAKAAKIFKIIKQSYDMNVLTKLILPDERWAKEVYGFDVYTTKDGHISTLTTNNATIEARLYTSGSELIAGLPYASVPGVSMAEKRNFLCTSTIEAIKPLIETAGGFLTTMKTENDTLYLIPSGHMIVTASRGATCLRWGVSGDEQDTARVIQMAKAILDSFPEYKNEGQVLPAFYEWLLTYNN